MRERQWGRNRESDTVRGRGSGCRVKERQGDESDKVGGLAGVDERAAVGRATG